LIVAGAAVDLADNAGKTALMIAVQSPSMYLILDEMECDAEIDVDEDSDEDSDMDAEERLYQRAKRKLEERRQSLAWCVQALLEATAPIQRAGFPDRASSLKFACDRLRLLGEVLATSHVIEHASALAKARALTLTADAQGIVIDFAHAVLASLDTDGEPESSLFA
jgi:hypothetical protein